MTGLAQSVASIRNPSRFVPLPAFSSSASASSSLFPPSSFWRRRGSRSFYAFAPVLDGHFRSDSGFDDDDDTFGRRRPRW